MRIYFFASKTEGIFYTKIQQTIHRLESLGHLVVTNLPGHEQSSVLESLQSSIRPRSSILDNIDAFIIESGSQAQEAAYLVAWAFSSQKAILYLVLKGQMIDPAIKMLQGGKKTKHLFKVRYYSVDKIKELVIDEVEEFEKFLRKSEREFANVKFTLRITPSIERYLRWKAQKRKITKANFLRLFLEQMKDADEGFKKHMSGK